MNGSIIKKSGRFYVVTRERQPDGTYRQVWHGGHATKRDASTALNEIINRINKGQFVEPSKVTVGEYLTDVWLPSIKSAVRPSTFDSYSNLVRWHLEPHLGAERLQRLSPQRLTTLYAKLLSEGRRDGTGGLSAKTVRYIHTVIHKALADAVDAGLVVQNVATRAKPPRAKATKARPMKVWTAAQLKAFLDHVEDDRLHAAWRLAASTGMRRGEVLGLRWEDVDLDAARVSIHRTLISVSYEVIESDAKTDNSVRVIDLDPRTVAILRSHASRQKRERLAAGPLYNDRGFVFAKEDGSPLHPDRFSQMFADLIAGAGLPKIRLHDLRHTHATLALQAGVPPKVISGRLGHASVAFTMDVYAHAIPAMQAEAAALVAALVDECG